MIISIPKELNSGETRVSLSPKACAKLIQDGYEIRIENGAGQSAFFDDASYQAQGCKVSADKASLLAGAQVIVKVGIPTLEEIQALPEKSIYIGFLNPLAQPELTQALNTRGITAFSMELVPRISRAQSADALSSQANIGGYKAALLAAEQLPKFFPMLTTAAGTIPPAKVLIIGVGVAGLQAIATARRLGSIVSAYDIRPEVKEQVHSLGAEFVEANIDEAGSGEGGYAKEVSEETKQKLQAALEKVVSESDVIITTAQVPGKKAPVLLTRAMVESMRAGSIVIDMAAGQGGNVEPSQPNQDVDVQGVRVMGPTNLPASMPLHASELYSKNISTLLQLMVKDGAINLNFEDDIIKGACVCHAGQIRTK
ncbi:MAG: NAD(P) transhydrogenase subunit alpha [Candidatus Omnitrophota bacterium]|jgi:NAD(P) transhydrogenase subunit alpha